MANWSRDAAALAKKYPDERWTGRCTRDDAATLLRYDHHVVTIGGRPALLLTYGWNTAPLEEWAEPLSFEVSFTYPRGHQRAPAPVQQIVDRLSFEPATG